METAGGEGGGGGLGRASERASYDNPLADRTGGQKGRAHAENLVGG